MSLDKPIYHYIAQKLNAMRNCAAMEEIAEDKRKEFQRAGDNYNDMQARKEVDHYYDQKNGHEYDIEQIINRYMPSGSGFDKGTLFDYSKSTDDKLVFTTAYHHMNSNGFYCGWSDHEVIVTPCFGGIKVKVTGKNYKDIKDYIAETFHTQLTYIVDKDGEKTGD